MQIEKLTESEEIVMKAIWDLKKEPVLSDVAEKVTSAYGKDWKPQTVSTFIAKLVRKQYLKLYRNGKVYTYKILVSEGLYNQEQLKRVYTFLYRSDRDTLKRDIEAL